jgi:hypothetical protein
MPYYRRHERRKAQRRWDQQLTLTLGEVRVTAELQSDEVLPDAVLVAEAAHYVPADRPSVNAARQWFGWRLIGMADSDKEREGLALRVLDQPARVPWGLMHGTSTPQRSRRGNITRP